MRLMNSSGQILTGVLLSFSAYAWNLPVGDFEFVAQGLEAELDDYAIKEKVLPQFAYISHWGEFDVQFGPNLNKMYLELEAF